MDPLKKELRGSPSRDEFKHWHKTLNKRFYSIDLDFVFIEKEPPGIAAILDYKKDNGRDYVTFSEVVAYNDLVRCGFPVFIVYRNEENNLFTITRYIWGDPKPEPPKVKIKLMRQRLTEKEFELWEGSLRKWYRERRTAP